jgi:hypothetical protein
MSANDGSRRDEVVIGDRAHLNDLLWFAAALVVIAAIPAIWVEASGETIEWRDENFIDRESPGWLVFPAFFAAVLFWPALKAYFLLRGPAAARLDRERLLLYPDASPGFGAALHLRAGAPTVDVPWDKVDRVVIWRLRRRWLGVVPGWEPQVGVLLVDGWYEVAQREPTKRQRESREHRKNGAPVRLPAMLKQRSVRLHAGAARKIADAVAEVAPQVAVVDERRPGTSKVVSAGSRDRR